MAVHWVNYDLNKSGQDYSKLIDYLKSHQSWAKPLKSSFFVRTSFTAAQLRDGVMSRIDSNDSVVVVDVTSDNWAAFNIPDDVAKWLQANI